MITLIAAVAKNGVIGRGNALPWRLYSDLKHFKAVTLGKPVIMGRKTFLSLGKPLPQRTNIVVSRDVQFEAVRAVIAPTLEAAFTIALADAMRRDVAEVCVIGGSEIYSQALPLADRLLITRIDLSPEGDSVFPPLDMALWDARTISSHPKGEKDDAAFDVVEYRRKASYMTKGLMSG